jgi:hypothetical protein
MVRGFYAQVIDALKAAGYAFKRHRQADGMKWRFVDRPLDRVFRGYIAKAAIADHFVADGEGYLRPHGAWQNWLKDRPHLAREDGSAFFFVVGFEPRQVHAEYRVAGVRLLYVSDELFVELTWQEQLGLAEPGSSCRYGFPKDGVPEKYEAKSERREHKGVEFDIRLIPRQLIRSVADAAVDAWPAWPSKGSRTTFGDAGDHLLNDLWYTIPYPFQPLVVTEAMVSGVRKAGFPGLRVGVFGATTPSKVVSRTDDWLIAPG